MQISLVVTVLNESKTIQILLKSILNQSLQANEVIIIDGGSKDDTVNKIELFKSKNPKMNLKLTIKKGNRSVGRNFAIKVAKNNVIAITDAGCELKSNWLDELAKTYQKEKTKVVAGYYSAKAKTDFQKAVAPYVLVMPDKLSKETFLPSTRSMLIEKIFFEQIGGFNEKLNDNEDYVLAKKLQKMAVKISFAKNAIVYWQPRKNLGDFYKMIFRFARGDVFANIVRFKVVLIFLRYIIFASLFFLSFKYFLSLMCFYLVWAIQKNKKYVGSGWKFLPLLQLTSDIAVMHGSIAGFWQKFSK